MSCKFSVFIAQSMDGFISRSDGGIDWLEALPTKEGEDCGYQDFYSTVSCLLMGRNSFEKVRSFPEWPYPNKRVVVWSSKLQPDSPLLRCPCRSSSPSSDSAANGSGGACCASFKVELCSSKTAKEVAEKLRGEGETRVYVDGGLTIQAFLQASLVDDMVVSTVPVLLMKGRRLFSAGEEESGKEEGGEQDVWWEVDDYKSWTHNGLTQTHFVKRLKDKK